MVHADLQRIKQRFRIVGNTPSLNRAIETAVQVASTPLTVLITGENGTGKESFSKIIHHFSPHKHGRFIAINCGAIPEGTIDSELFGHQKGAFTGAMEARQGYFEAADQGTLFLDEIGEMPLGTQARLLRVLESGEFIKVGASQVNKTNARVVAATNIDLQQAVQEGTFREDLYYRLNTVPIAVPPLRERGEDIGLLFRRFASDFADAYKVPPIQLHPEAKPLLMAYRFPGNIRQLKNLVEQMSILATDRTIDVETLRRYLPAVAQSQLPVSTTPQPSKLSEKELLYKLLFEMKHDLDTLKSLMHELAERAQDTSPLLSSSKRFDQHAPQPLFHTLQGQSLLPSAPSPTSYTDPPATTSTSIEDLSIETKEKELIIKALTYHNGKKKAAAKSLGISERTLYRKIKQYDLAD